MNKFIIGVLSLVLFSCCSKEDINDDDTPELNGEEIEVSFSSGVTTAIPTSSLGTRVPLEGAIPTSSVIGIYGIPSIYNEKEKYTLDKFAELEDFQEHLYNAKYEATEISATKSSLKQAYKAKYPSNQSGMDALSFYAYYPYTESPVYVPRRGFSIPVALNKDNMAEAIDYLYTDQTTVKISLKPVTLEFKHALARLDFKIYSDKGDLQIPGKKIRINSITIQALCSATGTMRLATGGVKEDNTNLETYVYTLTNSYIDRAASEAEISELDAKAKFLMIPAGDCITSVKLSLTPEGKDTEEYTIYNMAETETDKRIKLLQGEIITMNILYTPKDAVVDAALSKWGDSGISFPFHIDANKKP